MTVDDILGAGFMNAEDGSVRAYQLVSIVPCRHCWFRFKLLHRTVILTERTRKMIMHPLRLWMTFQV